LSTLEAKKSVKRDSLFVTYVVVVVDDVYELIRSPAEEGGNGLDRRVTFLNLRRVAYSAGVASWTLREVAGDRGAPVAPVLLPAVGPLVAPFPRSPCEGNTCFLGLFFHVYGEAP